MPVPPQERSLAAAELEALAEVAVEMADRVVTTTVQEMHGAIARRVFGAIGPSSTVSRVAHDGIAAGVYGAIRGAGKALGAAAGAAVRVGGAAPGARPLFSSPRGGLALAALNGLIGDVFEERRSDLRIELALRHGRRDLRTDRAALATAYPDASRKLALFVHGLMENEDAWRHGEADRGTYGSWLQTELGYTPLYLRYNSGLHISENGRRLSELLEALVAAWPVPAEELVLIGHSMGGLVSRSACHHGCANGLSWMGALRHVIYLGTPHTGAPLEKAVNLTAGLLGVAPESRPLADVLNTRSVGIKDLRFGYVCEDDWRDHDADALLRNTCTEVPLAEGVGHHFAAATLTSEARHPVGVLVGDLLVRVSSASGRSFALAAEQVRHYGRLNHFDLLNHPLVYAQIRDWLGAPDAKPKSGPGR